MLFPRFLVWFQIWHAAILPAAALPEAGSILA